MLVADKGWHPLLSTTAGIDKLMAPEDPQEPFDYFMPLFSVPAMVGTVVETIPAPKQYLSAEPKRVERWRREFEGVSEFKVGINWQGNPDFTVDRLRSRFRSAILPRWPRART